MAGTSGSIDASLPETLVLWDVDHTLIENGGVSKATYTLAFEILVGRTPTVRPATDGRTDFQIIRELLAANSVPIDGYVEIAQFEGVLAEAMKQKMSQLPQRGYILPGVLEVVTTLAAAATVVQSVLTGNVVHNARAKLAAFSLDTWLDVDVGGLARTIKFELTLLTSPDRRWQRNIA